MEVSIVITTRRLTNFLFDLDSVISISKAGSQSSRFNLKAKVILHSKYLRPCVVCLNILVLICK